MATGSTVVITYITPAGVSTNITSHVLFADARFQAQLAAIPGTFDITVIDKSQTLTFVTGGEITLDLDGTRYFGGYITSVVRTFALPADNTITHGPSAVKTREWKLSGLDYNMLLDKRIIRRSQNYTAGIAKVPGPINDGDLIRDKYPRYFDIPAGFDFDTNVQNVNILNNGYKFGSASGNGQGDTMRVITDALVIESSIKQAACVYWIDADKKFNWLAIQDTAAPFGFSDVPDGTDFIGFREGSQTEDMSSVANEVFVWGGSQWANGGSIVLGHASNSASISAHGRWQLAEVRVGQPGWQIQDSVDARAKALVSGTTTGTGPVNGAQGLVNPDQQFTLTWFAHLVPKISGVPQHLRPGFATELQLWTFSTDGGTTPYSITTPLRQVEITFPNLDPTGKGWVQFTGTFGIFLSDPVWLWSYLRHLNRPPSYAAVVNTADNNTTDPTYGAIYEDAPSGAKNGVNTIYTIPFAYIPNTSRLWVNGLEEARGTHYTESDPATGEFTTAFAPVSTDLITVWVRLA